MLSKRNSSIFLLLIKILFLTFIGVYILTLPAYYFLAIHMVSDALMPYEVVFCFIASFLSFFWVFKMAFEFNIEMKKSKNTKLVC